MKSWVLAASLLASAALTTNVKAADLDEGPPRDRYGSAYDDPRYADIYKYPPRQVAPSPYYGAPTGAYRDDDDDDDYRGPRRYSYAEPRAPYASHCVPREEVKARLIRNGWQDFRDAELRGDVATVQARRPSGRLFALTIDRCSGEIVSARPLEARPFGPYAYGPPPRRWDRAY